MALLILNKPDAIKFISDRLDIGADSVVVTADANGTFRGTVTFPPPPPAPPPQGSV
jgi:hypothetical protein